MESELPEWALMALEKRARLLERSLSDQNARNLLELDSDSDAIVMKEIDEARAHNNGAARMMMPPSQSVPKSRPNYRIAPKPVQAPASSQQNPAPQVQVQASTATVAASIPGMSNTTPIQPVPQSRQNGFSENMQAQPQQAYNSFPNNNNTTMGMMNINPFMFNPYIYPAHGYFNDTNQYEEFLKVQEEQLRIARQHFKLAMNGQSQAQNRSHSSSSSFMNSPFTQTPQPSPQVHTQFQSVYPSSIFPQPQNFQFQQHPSQPPPPQYQPPPQPLPLDLQSQHSQVSTIRASEHLERQSVQSEVPSTIGRHFPPKPHVRQPASQAARQPNRIQSEPAEAQQKIQEVLQPIYQADPMSIENEKIDKNNALAMFKRLESQQGQNSAPNYTRQHSGSYLRHVKTPVNQQKLPAQTYVQSKPQFQPQNNNNSSLPEQSINPSPEKKSILKKQSAYENKPPQQPSEPQIIRAQPEVIRQSAPPQKQQQSQVQNEPPARGMPGQSDLDNDQDQLSGVSIAKTASMFGERTRTKIPSASNAAPKREMTPPRSLSPPRESTPPREKSPEPPARAPQVAKASSPEPEIKEEIKSPTPVADDFGSASESDGNPEYFSEDEQIAQIIAPSHSPVKAAPVVVHRQPSPDSSKEATPVPYADIEEPKKNESCGE